MALKGGVSERNNIIGQVPAGNLFPCGSVGAKIRGYTRHTSPIDPGVQTNAHMLTASPPRCLYMQICVDRCTHVVEHIHCGCARLKTQHAEICEQTNTHMLTDALPSTIFETNYVLYCSPPLTPQYNVEGESPARPRQANSTKIERTPPWPLPSTLFWGVRGVRRQYEVKY